MAPQQVLKEVNDIFIEVLDNPDIVLTETSSAKNIEEWDSLNHILLVVAVEKHFKLKFTTAEIQSWANVGAMCAAIAQKV